MLYMHQLTFKNRKKNKYKIKKKKKKKKKLDKYNILYI